MKCSGQVLNENAFKKGNNFNELQQIPLELEHFQEMVMI